MQCSVESRKPGEIDGKDSIKENTNSKGGKKQAASETSLRTILQGRGRAVPLC